MPCPDFNTCQQLAADSDFVPVYRQLVADTLTPVTAFARIAEPNDSFLFESVVGGEKIGRYSFLGSGSFRRFDAYGKQVTVMEDGTSRDYECDDPMRELETLLRSFHTAHLPELPRFCG